jgi:hypothetical protein
LDNLCWEPNFELQSVAPAIMHTCCESRTVGQRLYERIPPPPGSLYGDTYVNWIYDVFVFGPPTVSLFLLRAFDDIHSVRDKIVRLGLAGKMDVGEFVTCFQHLELEDKNTPEGIE